LPGSGGGGGVEDYYTAKAGGSGGGVIRMIADGEMLIPSGAVIDADGADGTPPGGGGGSGGSIWITSASSINGDGTVRVLGGASTWGGGGSGGRISLMVILNAKLSANLLVSAYGGSSQQVNLGGAAGTIFRSWSNGAQTS
jgi:hypothetical protein